MSCWWKGCWLISLNYLISYLVANLAFSTERLSPGKFSVHYQFKRLPGGNFLATVNTFPSGLIIFGVWHFLTVLKSYFMALKLLGEIYWLQNPIQHLLSCGTVPSTRQISECKLVQFGPTVGLKNFPLHGWVRSTEFRTIQFILWQQLREHNSA